MGNRTACLHGGPWRPRQVFGVIAVLGVPFALGGCKVGPDFKRPEVSLPSGWHAANDPRFVAETAADDRWWRAFNDTSLDHLVELAYRQNLPLQIQGLRIVEARAQLGVVTGKEFPQKQELTASGTGVGLSRSAANALRIDRNFVYYQVGFDAAWELDLWGKYARGADAASAGLLASVADYYSAIVSLTAEVARTYVAVRTFEVLIGLAEDNAKLQETGLAIAESRFRNGATSELDPTQAKTQLESTRASIPALETSLAQARDALSTLLGQPPGNVDALLTGPKGIPKAPAKAAVGVPAEMLRRRPDIRSAELMAAAQCARIGIAKAELYPSFSLVGTIGLQATSIGGAPHNPFSPAGIFFTAGPQISWPFFNYGRLENAVRVEDARFQELLVDYHDTVLKAAREVEDAMTGFLGTEESVVFEQNAVVAAQRAVQIATSEYQEGATDFQRVLDAQRSLLDQENSLAETSSSVATNWIALYKALGGGWELAGSGPIVTDETQKEMKDRTNWGDMLSEPRGPEKRKPAVAGGRN